MELVRADLPVDVVVVLEQKERAGEAQGTERALRKRWAVGSGEHVFAGYGRRRTDRARTCVRAASLDEKWLAQADCALVWLQRELQGQL